MSSKPEDLVKKLRAIRDETARLPWRERREALRRCLDYELGDLARSRLVETLDGVKKALREGPVDGADAAELRAAAVAAQADIERVRRERDRLKQELAETRVAQEELEKLRQEKERLGQTLARMRQAGGSGGSASTFRDGIEKCLDGAKPDPGELGLDGRDAALFRALSELVGFALNCDVAINNLILEISGKGDSGGTTLAVMTRKLLRKRFLESLEDGGNAERLKDVLQQNVKFVLLMSLAYYNSYQAGVRGLLEDLDPQRLLDEAPGLMGVGRDYTRAFKAFQRKHGDLRNLTRDDIWEIYFSPRVRQELAEYLDDLPEM